MIQILAKLIIKITNKEKELNTYCLWFENWFWIEFLFYLFSALVKKLEDMKSKVLG